jgi:Reverse transcriptase (RNA-dependent DNA polymerase)
VLIIQTHSHLQSIQLLFGSFFSLAAQRNASIHQIDVKNAYLNFYLKDGEEIYIQLPPLYLEFCDLPSDLRKSQNVVWKLRRPLYGTKQGARTWYLEVIRVFTLLGYTVSLADEAVLYKFGHDSFTIVAVATDDFTIISESDSSTELLKKQIRKHWGISDLGPINWLLGMKISRDAKSRTISLCQQSYIELILVRFNLENARSAVTPLEPGIDLSPESPSVSPTLLTASEKRTYREMIGSLMYVTVMT